MGNEGWQQLCSQPQSLPVAGKGTQGVAHAAQLSHQPLRGDWGAGRADRDSGWHSECKGRKLLRGKNTKQKEGTAGGNLSKAAESRPEQLPMPYSVLNVPEGHL